MGDRDPLRAARRAAIAAHRQAERERMAPEEAGRRMRKAMHDALDRNGTVTRDDMLRENIPATAVDLRFRAILMEVLEERKAGGIRA